MSVLAIFALVQAGLVVAVIAPFVELPAPHPRREVVVFAILALTTFLCPAGER